MSKHNRNFHTVKSNGMIILHSNHLGDIVEVNINKEKRRFYGIQDFDNIGVKAPTVEYSDLD